MNWLDCSALDFTLKIGAYSHEDDVSLYLIADGCKEDGAVLSDLFALDFKFMMNHLDKIVAKKVTEHNLQAHIESILNLNEYVQVISFNEEAHLILLTHNLFIYRSLSLNATSFIDHIRTTLPEHSHQDTSKKTVQTEYTEKKPGLFSQVNASTSTKNNTAPHQDQATDIAENTEQTAQVKEEKPAETAAYVQARENDFHQTNTLQSFLQSKIAEVKEAAAEIEANKVPTEHQQNPLSFVEPQRKNQLNTNTVSPATPDTNNISNQNPTVNKNEQVFLKSLKDIARMR